MPGQDGADDFVAVFAALGVTRREAGFYRAAFAESGPASWTAAASSALGEDDRRYLAFAGDFEQRFVNQGPERRGIGDTPDHEEPG